MAKSILDDIKALDGAKYAKNTFKIECLEAVSTSKENDTLTVEFLKDLGSTYTAKPTASSSSSSSTGPKKVENYNDHF